MITKKNIQELTLNEIKNEIKELFKEL